MAGWHWTIGSSFKSEDFTFTVNPLDITGMFPSRAYNELPVLSGSSIKQFPEVDTRLRTIRWDVVPDENTAHRDFIMGDDATDSDTILSLQDLDDDGGLTTYWLGIPEAYKHVRPEGYRADDSIPIRVLEVRTVPAGSTGKVRWQYEMLFHIVPRAEADYTFALDSSPLGSHAFVTSAFDSVYTYDNSLGNYADETDDSFAGGAPFPDGFSIAAGDMLYFGASDTFQGVLFEVDTLETVAPDIEQGHTAHTWQFWNGSTWASLTVDDQTGSFTKDDEAVTWTAQLTWGSGSLTAILGESLNSDALFWVRITIGTVVTAFDFDKTLRM